MAANVIVLLVFGVFAIAWIGFLIWLLSLIIRALLKYLKTEEVRKEKAVVTKSLGEKLKNYRISSMMTQEFVAEQFIPGLDIEMMYQDMYWASEGYLWDKVHKKRGLVW